MDYHNDQDWKPVTSAYADFKGSDRPVVLRGKMHQQKKKKVQVVNDRIAIPVGPPMQSIEKLQRLTQSRYIQDMRNCGRVELNKSPNATQLQWEHCKMGEVNRVLDQTEEEFYVPPKLSYQQRLKIQQGRQLLNMTQQQLATAIQEKVEVVQKYENGSAIPERRILRKISRALNTSL
jgi:DNA-binding transcriptional regulator YiaG